MLISLVLVSAPAFAGANPSAKTTPATTTATTATTTTTTVAADEKKAEPKKDECPKTDCDAKADEPVSLRAAVELSYRVHGTIRHWRKSDLERPIIGGGNFGSVSGLVWSDKAGRPVCEKDGFVFNFDSDVLKCEVAIDADSGNRDVVDAMDAKRTANWAAGEVKKVSATVDEHSKILAEMQRVDFCETVGFAYAATQSVPDGYTINRAEGVWTVVSGDSVYCSSATDSSFAAAILLGKRLDGKAEQSELVKTNGRLATAEGKIDGLQTENSLRIEEIKGSLEIVDAVRKTADTAYVRTTELKDAHNRAFWPTLGIGGGVVLDTGLIGPGLVAHLGVDHRYARAAFGGYSAILSGDSLGYAGTFSVYAKPINEIGIGGVIGLHGVQVGLFDQDALMESQVGGVLYGLSGFGDFRVGNFAFEAAGQVTYNTGVQIITLEHNERTDDTAGVGAIFSLKMAIVGSDRLEFADQKRARLEAQAQAKAEADAARAKQTESEEE